jgi:hypothetical protein
MLVLPVTSICWYAGDQLMCPKHSEGWSPEKKKQKMLVTSRHSKVWLPAKTQ